MMTAQRPGELRAMRLVARREVTEALRRKAVWITAGLFFLASLAAVVLPDLLSGIGSNERDVALAGEVPAQVEALLIENADALDMGIEMARAGDLDVATDAVSNGSIDVLVRFDTEPVTIVVNDENDQRLITLVRSSIGTAATIDRLDALGLGDAEIAEVLAPAQPVIEVLDTEQGGRQLVAVIAALAMYLVLLVLAMQISNSVAIEKSSRVSEVLLAVTSSRVLLFGKVIGVGLIGALTLVAGALPIVVRTVSGASMPPGTGTTLVVAAVFSMLGIALYLCLAGSLGALVERTEDVSTTVGPLTIILIAGYLIAQAASDTIVGVVLGLFPLTSPMVMPSRVALDAASWAEVVVSAAILAVSVVITARVAAVIYRRAIVRTGQRVKLRDLRAG